MHHDNESLLNSIVNYRERLNRNPESLLFAHLSDACLQAGQVDEALRVARQGTARHPDYIAGQRALAMASHAAGLDAESLPPLRKVVQSTPEDVEAQRLLGRLLAAAGDHDAAKRAFETALDFCPDDPACLAGMQSLLQKAGAGDSGFGFGPLVDEPEEEIIELSESDIVEDVADELQPAPVETQRQDPLTTGTLAELYVQQGFVEKALGIYRSILADQPDNQAARKRVAELESSVTASSSVSLDAAVPTGDKVAASAQSARETVIATMETWLDNIRRLRLCH
ncbi:MAG TPA: tetratricopeptide repeat protein [Deltaproteobacteria bacterium]|nr:tetratricopeptide repeat protein [Deltaproteobacteria bacterium]